MSKGRLEAFSDGVLAIIITIMVLELRPPPEAKLEALRPLFPHFLCYLLSFVFLAIYWNNHHHLWQAVHHVTGGVLWANMHLLFWLSLVPFTTNWMGNTNFAEWPVAVYGIVMFMAAIAYFILTRVLLSNHDDASPLAVAIGADFKGKISLLCYIAAIPLAFVEPYIACGIYVGVALLWLVPDRRIESTLEQHKNHQGHP